MTASQAPVRRLLFVADAAVAEVHDLPPEVRALLSAAADVYVVTPTLPGRLAWLADDVDQFRHLADQRLDTVLSHTLRSSEHANWQERGLEKRLQKRFGLPLISYAVDPRGHATGAQRR
jgi:hypothetical protein